MIQAIKRKLPVILAICVLSVLLVPSSFAISGGSTITVIGTNENHEYTAYQIFTGTADSHETTLSNIQWGADVDAAGLLNAAAQAGETAGGPLYGKFEGVTAETSAAGFALLLQDLANEEARAFAGMAADYVSGDGYTGTFSSGNYIIQVPGQGYYIVVDSLADAGAQEMISGYIVRVVKNNTDVEPKISVPIIEKKVYDSDSEGWTKGADHSIGEDILFRVTVQLPDNFKDYEQYTCIIRDQFSDGLTYGSIRRCFIKGKEENAEEIGISEDNYSASVNADNLLTIDIDAIAAGGDDGSTITVEYLAQLNDAAAAGTAENNAVTLTYSNDPTNSSNSTLTSDTPDDVVHVYTYRLDIAKEIKGTGTALPGAGFILSRGTGDEMEYAEVANGKMADWTNDENAATVLYSVADGSITLDGLGDGTYQLTEVEAPDGYDLLEQPVTIVLDGRQNEDGLMDSLTCNASGQGLKDGSVAVDMAAGAAAMTVENTKGSLLPSTGGAGTVRYFAGGLLLMAAAGFVPVIRRRRRVEG